MRVDRIKLLFFCAEKCGGCKEMKPIILQIEKEKIEGIDFEVEIIDKKDHSNKPLVDKYQIGMLPSYVFLDKEDKVLTTMDGGLTTTKETFIECIKTARDTIFMREREIKRLKAKISEEEIAIEKAKGMTTKITSETLKMYEEK